MPRIGKQRERMRCDAPCGLCDDVNQVQRDPEGKGPAIRGRGMGVVMAERAVGMVMARMSILLIMVMAVPMTVIMMGGMIMPMTMTGFVVMLVAHWRALSSVCVPAMLRHGTRTFSGWGHAARMGHPH